MKDRRQRSRKENSLNNLEGRTGEAPVAAQPEVAVENDRGGPMRSCAIVRKRLPRGYLLRFVRSPEGALVEDLADRLPGRGIHVVPTVDAITRLLRKNGGGVDVERVVARCGAGLTRRFLEGMGLARRAGAVRRGLREVEGWFLAGERPLLILAADIADNSRQKFAGLVDRHGVKEWLELLDGERLGAACGWSRTTILAVNDQGLAQRLRLDASRWRAFHVGEGLSAGVADGAGTVSPRFKARGDSSLAGSIVGQGC
ncbi:MAG: DUF448 domain-containing protein [Magnetococcales bacterium]|nr:DUF448 domain-containing protein [Magnetococcales bacterium]